MVNQSLDEAFTITKKMQSYSTEFKVEANKKTANLSIMAQEYRCKRYPIGYWQNKTNQSKFVGNKLL